MSDDIKYKAKKTKDGWGVLRPDKSSALEKLTKQEAQVIAMALSNYHIGNKKCCRARDIEFVD